MCEAPLPRQHAETIISLAGWDPQEEQCVKLATVLNGPWWEWGQITIFVTPLVNCGLLPDTDVDDEMIYQLVVRTLLSTLHLTNTLLTLQQVIVNC